MTRRQGQEVFSFFQDKIFVFEQRGVRGIPQGKLLIVGEEALVQLFWYFLRRDPLIDRYIQRVLTLFALIDQPDIQLVLVCVHPKAPGGNKGHFFTAVPAFMDHSAFFFC